MWPFQLLDAISINPAITLTDRYLFAPFTCKGNRLRAIGS